MENAIQRVNFFNGQFLKEVDFRAEQLYHLHMRRRLTYMLFERAGVIPNIEIGNDDLQFEITDHVTRSFRVRPGTAVALIPSTREGKEIVLREPSATLSMLGAGITGTSPGFVVLKQLDTPKKDPPSEGGVDLDTRVEEGYELSIRPAWPPAIPLADQDEFVFLGRLSFNTTTNLLVADYGTRQVARLRSSLIVAAPAPTATLSSIAVTPGSPSINVGSTQTFTATGTFSDGGSRLLIPGDGVVWSSTNAALIAIDATTGVASALAPGGPVTIRGTVGAISGTASATAQIAVPAPSGLAVAPGLGFGGQPAPIVLSGLNLHVPALAVGTDATNVANTANPITLRIERLPDAPLTITPATVGLPAGGLQTIQFQLPLRPAAAVPPWTDVTIRLSHLGGNTTVPFRFLG